MVLLSSLSGLQDVLARGLERSITVRFNDIPLAEALVKVEKASGCTFFYDANMVDLSEKVSLNAKKQDLKEALSSMLEETNLAFEISNNQIALFVRTHANTTASVAPVAQQQGTVKGKVVDVNGEPIIGANIVEKGTTNGIITDIDGNFTLSVAKGAVLEISYIGYVTQEVKVTSNTLSITMREDSQALEEVVVTGFGLAQKKATLTGAVTAVGADDISRSVASTASGALVGKIAGLNTRQTDGRPGSTTALQIRNMGSPLYVIDGVQSDASQFNNIDFNDIEAISVLKDASAAIYGVRAANGVVVVTTKKGKRNSKNTASINSYYGWQSLSTFPKPASAETYIKNYIQSETVQGKADYTYSKEDYAKWQQGTEKGYVPFDWFDYIWETAPQYYVNANISGGSDKINYYVSLGHLNQDAMIVNYGGFKRYNVQMNLDAQITERLKLGVTMNGRIEEIHNPGVPGVDDYWCPRFGTYRNLPTKRPFANDNPNYPTLTSTDASTNFAWLNYDLSGEYKDTKRVVQLQGNVEKLQSLFRKELEPFKYGR